MNELDFSKVDRDLLEALARHACQQTHDAIPEILKKIQEQAKVKTRAEIQEEIGEILRKYQADEVYDRTPIELYPPDCVRLRRLVRASRTAK